MQIIPSIDLWQGQVVRLLKGSYDDVTVYSDDPVALAREWRKSVERLHIVDLAGAKDGHAAHSELIRSIVEAFGPGVQIGGGVRSLETIDHYLRLGVDRVVMGTAAVATPELVDAAIERHPNKVILALDAKNGYVATAGWQDVSSHRAVDLAQAYRGRPIAAVLYTDIERDGTEVGPNVAATSALATQSGLPVIASGGVGTLAHLAELARASEHCGGGICGAVIGRALHERRFSLQEAVAAAA
jgi:phosphoribosylformimino-5-aminoimidazole carboxamide ribotide isomerase